MIGHSDRPLMRRVRRWMLLAAALLSVVTALSFLGTRHWSLELLSHFRVQFAALALLLAVPALFVRQWRVAGLLGVLMIANAVPPASYLLWRPATKAQAAPAGADVLSLKVAYHNMRNRAADHAGFFAYLGEAEPDVVVLTEMDYQRRADLFHGLRRGYPYFASTPGPSIFNVAVFSRYPLTEVSRMLKTSNNWPILHVRVCPDKERSCLRVVALHTHPPLGRWAAVRNTAMQEAALEAAGGEEPVILVGDLNCTPWSPRFREMLELGGLRDGNKAGLKGTWAARSPLLGLPVDHILVGPGVAETDRTIGPALGSDHFLLMAELKFAAPPVAEEESGQ